MRLLDKYILSELIAPFIFGVCAFSSIFIGTTTLFRIAQYVTKYGASVNSVVKLFIYSLPGIIVLTFPMSMLLASLLSFGRLSSSGEITAMKSGGLGFFRLALPVFGAAFLVSIFATAFNELVVPAANTASKNVIRYEIEKDFSPRSQKNLFIPEEQNGVIERVTFARMFDSDNNTMYAVTIQDFDNDKLVRVEDAEKAIWEKDKWIMYNGIIYELSSDGQTERTMNFVQQVMPVKKAPSSISSEQKHPDEMSIKELRQRIRTLNREQIESSEYQMELQKKLAIPMASFVFALIGAPLGLQPQRSSSSIGLGLSIIIIFIYYAIMTLTEALGQGGVIPAVIAAWIPNIIGTATGLLLVKRNSS